ncbi:MAG: DUF3179 domain-containing protein [Gemmatimonadetes bacterium]|nr:DUF3179 domain-containing protein [Gemmatimonadota bacterium]
MVCNSGTSLVPTIGGRMHHFENVGLYDALFVMQDAETKTLWNHISGEALYGSMVGHTLGPVGNLLQMNVTQALALDPAMQVAISDRMYFAGGRQFGTAGGAGRGAGPGPTPPPGRAAGPGGRGGAAPGGRGAALTDDRTLAPMFSDTLGKEDARRPRMELGLGIWTAQTRRYYPLARIRERGEALVDVLDGRKLLVYIDPETNTPAALFADAGGAAIDHQDVRLDSGAVVRSGVVYDAAGGRLPVERPQQIFTRWYGFALTFPGADVYGEQAR